MLECRCLDRPLVAPPSHSGSESNSLVGSVWQNQVSEPVNSARGQCHNHGGPSDPQSHNNNISLTVLDRDVITTGY